jgi:hypothetical protein
MSDRIARLATSPPAPAQEVSTGSSVDGIAAEMRRQKELDDARRLGFTPQAEVERIRNEMAMQKKRDDERRARGKGA